jgi:hypothetical protein
MQWSPPPLLRLIRRLLNIALISGNLQDLRMSRTSPRFLVEPRGFEPLTSAMQRRIHNVAVVHWCSEIPVNKHILRWVLSSVFTVVRLDWCQLVSDRFDLHFIRPLIGRLHYHPSSAIVVSVLPDRKGSLVRSHLGGVNKRGCGLANMA